MPAAFCENPPLPAGGAQSRLVISSDAEDPDAEDDDVYIGTRVIALTAASSCCHSPLTLRLLTDACLADRQIVQD